MPWYNHITQQVSDHRPERIRLETGLTLTSEEVTDQALEAAGWRWQEPSEPIDLLAFYQAMDQ